MPGVFPAEAVCKTMCSEAEKLAMMLGFHHREGLAPAGQGGGAGGGVVTLKTEEMPQFVKMFSHDHASYGTTRSTTANVLEIAQPATQVEKTY